MFHDTLHNVAVAHTDAKRLIVQLISRHGVALYCGARIDRVNTFARPICQTKLRAESGLNLADFNKAQVGSGASQYACRSCRDIHNVVAMWYTSLV